MCFKHIYSTFQSISVQTHQSWMLIDFNFAKIWKHPDRPPLTAFACNTVSRLRVKTHLVRTGHICGQVRCRQMTWCEPIFLLEGLSWNSCQYTVNLQESKRPMLCCLHHGDFFVLVIVYIECFMWHVIVTFLLLLRCILLYFIV